jgi:hypothetical protein
MKIIPSSDPAIIQRYQQLLCDASTWDNLHLLAGCPTTMPDHLMDCFKETIYSCAALAGYKIITISDTPRHSTVTKGRQQGNRAAAGQQGSSRSNDWHDSTCKQLQLEIRAINQHTADPAELERRHKLDQQYRRRVNRLSREYKAEQTRQKIHEWQHDRNSFWKGYRSKPLQSPFDAQTMAAHFQQKMNGYAAPSSTARATQRPQDIDVTADCPTVPEIIAAIRKMHSEAAGVDGIPTDLFKPYAPQQTEELDSETAAAGTVPASQFPSQSNSVAHVAAALHTVFKRISESASVPTEWRTAMLSPLYKSKGDLEDVSSYRPLSIPTVACRIWSSIINHKLLSATTDKGILPDVMYGFMPGKSCIDPVFILRHLADMQKAGEGNIFGVAFMDLSGAYDSICRDLLFEKLKSLVGLSDHTLRTLRHLYHDTQCIIKCNGSLSTPFTVGCGVRQGCPLSVTLFNLFIADLDAHLKSKCTPGTGVQVVREHETRTKPPTQWHKSDRKRPASQPNTSSMLFVNDLGYADDISLAGSTPEELQELLDAFAAYCVANALIINPSKCNIVVFSGGGAWPGKEWTVDGHVVARVHEFKHLGIVLNQRSNWSDTADHRLSRMTAAQSAVFRRLKELRISCDPSIIADLFDIIPAAAGNFGCEIWSTPLLGTWDSITKCKLQQYQASVYKRALGVPGSASNLLALVEMGRYPMQVHWLVRCVKFWNKRVAEVDQENRRLDSSDHPTTREHSLMAQVFITNVHYGLEKDVPCWSRELCAGLTLVQPDIDWRAHMLQLKPIEHKLVAQLACHAFCNHLQCYTTPVDADVNSSRQRCKYAQWMRLGGAQAEHSELLRPAYLTALTPKTKKRALSRLRLSHAPVRATREHTSQDSLYSSRICTRCDKGVVDDEQHWLFDCDALGGIRQNHASTIERYPSLPELMAAVYDRSPAMAVLEYVFEATKFVSGHRQGSRAVE